MTKMADMTIYGKNLKQVAQRATIANLSPMCQGQISFQKIWTHPSFNASFLLHESIKMIQSKTTEKKWKHHFPHYKVYGGMSKTLKGR